MKERNTVSESKKSKVTGLLVLVFVCSLPFLWPITKWVLYKIDPPRTPDPRASAMGTMRTIFTSQFVFKRDKMATDDQGNPRYGTLRELVDHEMLDETLLKVKGKYIYLISLGDSSGQSFEAYGLPVEHVDHFPRYFIDETGRLTFSTQGLPDRNSEEMD